MKSFVRFLEDMANDLTGRSGEEKEKKKTKIHKRYYSKRKKKKLFLITEKLSKYGSLIYQVIFNFLRKSAPLA